MESHGKPRIMSSQLLRCRTLRALGFLSLVIPGVSLRSTPGFMLPPAPRAKERKAVLSYPSGY
jgi:hypothetical protein